MKSDDGLSIAAVERETGLGKDTLRVWERRYGFPQPDRDDKGERLYPAAQVSKLRHIKRLMDKGFRPGKLLALDDQALAELTGPAVSVTEPSDLPAPHAELFNTLRQGDGHALRQHLQQQLLKQGLQRFVLDTVAPATCHVGEAWARGEIDVAAEHLYTEQVQNVLRGALNAVAHSGERPRVLLTTFPDELHTLGLLMAEAVLVPEGAYCVSLGSQMPVSDIANAAVAGRFDLVALSFSAAYPPRQAISGLTELAARLPEPVTLWVGGSALAEKAPPSPRIRFIGNIADTVDALNAWRSASLS